MVFFANRDSRGQAGSSIGYTGLIHTWRKLGGKLVIADEKNAEVGYDESEAMYRKFKGK